MCCLFVFFVVVVVIFELFLNTPDFSRGSSIPPPRDGSIRAIRRPPSQFLIFRYVCYFDGIYTKYERFLRKFEDFCENTWPQGGQGPGPDPWAPWLLCVLCEIYAFVGVNYAYLGGNYAFYAKYISFMRNMFIFS